MCVLVESDVNLHSFLEPEGGDSSGCKNMFIWDLKRLDFLFDLAANTFLMSFLLNIVWRLFCELWFYLKYIDHKVCYAPECGMIDKFVLDCTSYMLLNSAIVNSRVHQKWRHNRRYVPCTGVILTGCVPLGTSGYAT